MNAHVLARDAVKTTWAIATNPELSEQIRVRCRRDLLRRRPMIEQMATDPDIPDADRAYFEQLLSHL